LFLRMLSTTFKSKGYLGSLWVGSIGSYGARHPDISLLRSKIVRYLPAITLIRFPPARETRKAALIETSFSTGALSFASSALLDGGATALVNCTGICACAVCCVAVTKRHSSRVLSHLLRFAILSFISHLAPLVLYPRLLWSASSKAECFAIRSQS